MSEVPAGGLGVLGRARFGFVAFFAVGVAAGAALARGVGVFFAGFVEIFFVADHGDDFGFWSYLGWRIEVWKIVGGGGGEFRKFVRRGAGVVELPHPFSGDAYR